MKRILGFLAVLFPAIAVAGPFGLEMGMTLESIKRITPVTATEKTNLYKITKVPNPHDAFEAYLLIITPRAGLCKISAVGKTIRTSVYGERLKDQFLTMEKLLKEKYGNSKKFDFLRSGSIWNEPKDWMMALLKGERTLAVYWDHEERSNLDGTNINGVTLEARAFQTEKGFIRLAYEFSNMKECMQEDQERGKSAL